MSENALGPVPSQSPGQHVFERFRGHCVSVDKHVCGRRLLQRAGSGVVAGFMRCVSSATCPSHPVQPPPCQPGGQRRNGGLCKPAPCLLRVCYARKIWTAKAWLKRDHEGTACYVCGGECPGVTSVCIKHLHPPTPDLCPRQGCFWGVEQKFLQKFKDAVQTTVGYTGGKTQEPTYMQVRHFAGLLAHTEERRCFCAVRKPVHCRCAGEARGTLRLCRSSMTRRA